MTIKYMQYLASLTLLLLSSTALGLNPLEIKGYKFFDSESGEEVVIRGIDYYPRPNKGNLNENSLDLFTEEYRHIWERDIPHFQELGVNAIRLYAVDPNQNHDAFMCALEEAGIYVIVGLAHDCPTCAVTRDQAPDCYPVELKEQGQRVVMEFAKHPNTLAFSAGNEVNHFAPPSMPEWNAPCQKKFIRDMREYVASCSHSMRKIPVGLVAADSDREQNTLYYNCQSDPNDEFDYAEWYGLNSYVTCNGTATKYEEAVGLETLRTDFEEYNMSIPVLLTEFGCLSETFPTIRGYKAQRTFLQAKWMLSEATLRDRFAGGFAFEYSMEVANPAAYGVGFLEPTNCDDISIPCDYHPLPCFDNLKRAYNVSNIVKTTTKDEFVPPPGRTGRTQCPDNFAPLTSFHWEADETAFLQCPPKSTLTASCSAPRKVTGVVSGLSVEGTVCLAILLFALLVRGVRYYNQRAMMVRDLEECESNESDESTGLLSLKPWRDTKTPYRAIDSDSSDDEMLHRYD